jgi:hypothetical protein
MSMILLTPLLWLKKARWALSVLTVLYPFRYYQKERVQNYTHRELTMWTG